MTNVVLEQRLGWR